MTMRAARSALLPLLLVILALGLAAPAAGQQKKDSGDLGDKERAFELLFLHVQLGMPLSLS